MSTQTHTYCEPAHSNTQKSNQKLTSILLVYVIYYEQNMNELERMNECERERGSQRMGWMAIGYSLLNINTQILMDGRETFIIIWISYEETEREKNW